MRQTGKTICILALLFAYLAVSLAWGGVLRAEEAAPAYSELGGERISLTAQAHTPPVVVTFIKVNTDFSGIEKNAPCLFGALIALLLVAAGMLLGIFTIKVIPRKEYDTSVLSTFLGGVSPPVASF